MKLTEKVYFLFDWLRNIFCNFSKPIGLAFLLSFIVFYLIATLVLAPGFLAIYLSFSLLAQILWWLSDAKSDRERAFKYEKTETKCK